jgi:hypothetical protein
MGYALNSQTAKKEMDSMNKESETMVKPLLRGLILATLTMNLLENFEIATLGYSMIIYAMTMKAFNVGVRRLENV